MDQDGIMDPHLQCGMHSKSVSEPETLLHMHILFTLSEPMVYGLLLNIHGTIE